MEIPTVASAEHVANELATEYARGWMIPIKNGGTWVVGTNDDSEGEDLGRWLPSAEVAYYVPEGGGFVAEATAAYEVIRDRINQERAGDEPEPLPPMFKDDVDRERYQEARDDLRAERGER
jgi:hypothetical protein